MRPQRGPHRGIYPRFACRASRGVGSSRHPSLGYGFPELRSVLAASPAWPPSRPGAAAPLSGYRSAFGRSDPGASPPPRAARLLPNSDSRLRIAADADRGCSLAPPAKADPAQQTEAAAESVDLSAHCHAPYRRCVDGSSRPPRRTHGPSRCPLLPFSPPVWLAPPRSSANIGRRRPCRRICARPAPWCAYLASWRWRVSARRAPPQSCQLA